MGTKGLAFQVPIGHNVDMHLSTYLKKKRISHDVFAESIGVHRSSVSRFCARTRKPDLDTLEKIHKVTRGVVTAKDFFSSTNPEEA